MSVSKLIALDCGSSRVSIAAFRAESGGSFQLERFATSPLPPEAWEDNMWAQYAADTGVALARSIGLSGKVHVVIPGHLCLTKFIRVARVAPAKLARVLQFEAAQNIPYALSEVAWGHQQVSDDGVDAEVALAAAKLEILLPLCERLRTGGLEVQGITPSFGALLPLVRALAASVQGMTVAINIGFKSSTLVIVDGERVIARSVPVAGYAMTQAMAEQLRLSPPSAEQLKLEVLTGVKQVEAEGPELLALDSAVTSLVNRLGVEVTRTLAAFRKTGSTDQPAQVVIFGGGVRLGNVAELLGQRLRLPVSVLDPMEGMSIAPAAEAVARPVAATLADLHGMALQVFRPGPQGLDLLPKSVAARNLFRRQRPFYVLAAACVAAASFIPSQGYEEEADNFVRAERSVQAQIAQLQQYSADIRDGLEELNASQQKIAGIEQLVATRGNWLKFFTDLQERLVKVDNVWLDQLQVTRAAGVAPQDGDSEFGGQPPAVTPGETVRMILRGRLLDRENPLSRVSPTAERHVRALVQSLADSDFIDAVENETYDSSQPGMLQFGFTLVVNPATPL